MKTISTFPRASASASNINALVEEAYEDVTESFAGDVPIATRYDKTDTSFAAAIYLVAGLIAAK